MSESKDADAHISGACVRLNVAGIEVAAGHGVYPEERERGNRFLVDVELDGNFDVAARSDDSADTVDFDRLVEHVRAVSRRHHYNLIESFADAIAIELLRQFPRVTTALVRVHKLTLHRLEKVDSVSAEASRGRA